MNALRELVEKLCSVYFVVILQDQAFTVAGQVFGEDTPGGVLRTWLVGGRGQYRFDETSLSPENCLKLRRLPPAVPEPVERSSARCALLP